MYDSHNSAFDVAGGDSSQYAGDPGDNELLQDATYLLLREQLAHLKKVVADLPNPEAILDQEEGRLANDDNAIATDATASSATAASPRTVRFDPNVTVFHPPPEDYSSSEDEGDGEHPVRNAQEPSEKQKGQTNDFFKSAMNSRRNIVRKPRKRATKETKEQKKEQKNKAKRGMANELRGTNRGAKGRWKATLSKAVRRKGRSSSPPTPTSTKRTLQRRSNSTRPQHWNRLDGESDDADNGDSAHCRSDENDNIHRDGPIIRITVDQSDTKAPDASHNRSRSSHGRQQQQQHSASNMRAGDDSRDAATSESETDEENTKAVMGFESVQATESEPAQGSEHVTRQTRAGFGVARADSIKLRRRHKQKHAQHGSETASDADTALPTPKSSSDRAHHKRRHFSVGSIRRVRSESTSSHQTRKQWTRSSISQRTHKIRLNLKRPRLRGGGGEWNSYSYSSREAIRRLASERADEERDTDAGMDRGGNYDDASSPEIRNSERSRRTNGGFESASAERAPPATFSMTESYSLDRGAGVLERREGGPPAARSAAERSGSSICSSCAVQ